MKDRSNVAKVGPAVRAALELIGIEVIGKLQGNEVLPFFGAVQAVDYQDVVEA